MTSQLIRLWTPTTHHAVPPSPAWPEFSIDVSNYQGNLDDAWFERWAGQGFGGLIVQCVTGDDGRSYTSQQCEAALAHKWALAGYGWCSPGDAADDSNLLRRLALYEEYAQHLVFLALDVEQEGLSPQDVDTGLARCDVIVANAPLYTGKWFFDKMEWSDKTYWPERRLWDSHYDRVNDVNANFEPYGGWTQAWLKQYTDTPIDQNVCRV